MASKTSNPQKLAYSVEEAIAALGICRAHFYKLIDTGAIRTVKAGRRRLVPASALRAFLGEEAKAA